MAKVFICAWMLSQCQEECMICVTFLNHAADYHPSAQSDDSSLQSLSYSSRKKYKLFNLVS